MEFLQFRIAFNLRAALHPELIAHLSGIPRRDWPAVLSNLAQCSLINGSAWLSNSVATSTFQPRPEPPNASTSAEGPRTSGVMDLSLEDVNDTILRVYMK